MRTKGMKRNSLIVRFLVLSMAMGLLLVSSCKEEVAPTDTVKPEADFKFTSEELVVTFENTSKGAESYAWDFKDGQTSSEESPEPITYSAEGTYDVVLTVTRANGQTDSITRQVTVRKTPIANFTFTTLGLEATFTNTSSNATDYTWDFGDGTPLSDVESPAYTYAAGGTYTVKLIATKGALNDDIEAEVTVSIPNASFEAEPIGLVVTLTNSSTGAESYAWNYGDGATSTDAADEHTYTYTAAGDYDIILVATAADGLTSSDTVSVTLSDIVEPEAGFTYVINDKVVTFTNTSTAGVSYDWDFDDGQVSTDEDPAAVTYTTYGYKTVTLTVTGMVGSTPSVSTVDVPVSSVSFVNGTFDDYGDVDPDKQLNNDDWEKPAHWTGNPDFRAGGISTDGKKLANGDKTIGLKMKNNNTRGAYQEVAVEIGKTYTVTFDVAGDEVAGTNVRLDVYVLNERIFTESDPVTGNTYAHLPVNDTDLTGKGKFTTMSTTFIATTDVVTFYMLETAFTFDGDTEVWVDNVVIVGN